MVWGGGKYVSQNKKLPGVYNKVSTSAAGTAIIADRGTVACLLELDWGEADKIVTITAQDFMYNSAKYFGYGYDDEKVREIRDVFKHANKILLYRLNGAGNKGQCDIASAKYSGPASANINIKVTGEKDEFFVSTYYDAVLVDEQKVADINGLVDNDFVVWTKSATLTAATYTLTAGTNSDATGTNYQAALDALESYAYNTMYYAGDDKTTAELLVNYTIRMRDEIGKYFGVIIPKIDGVKPDHEGVYVIDNGAWCVPWFAGAIGGCRVGKSITGLAYDGEASGNVEYTAVQMEAVLDNGYICLHRVGDNVLVSRDLTSFVSVTAEKGESFKFGQVVRSLDTYLETVAAEFTDKCMGKQQNNAAGRSTVFQIAYEVGKTLQNNYDAIAEFTAESVSVEAGEAMNAVLLNSALTFVGAMDTLYINVTMQ